MLGLLANLGLAATFGATEAGDGDESLVIRDVELRDAAGRKHTIERIEIRRFDWREHEHPRHLAARVSRLIVPLEGDPARRAGRGARKTHDAGLRELFDAAARFVASPGEISVAADPPPGISLNADGRDAQSRDPRPLRRGALAGPQIRGDCGANRG